MSSADKIQVQGNAVFVNGVTFGTCETYKGSRVRLWLHDKARTGLPVNFTILDNTPDALKNFVAARRQAVKSGKA